VGSQIFREIKQSIGSGEIAALPKEKLVQFSAALAQSQAYTYFSASQFPQICKTVELHLAARLHEEALAKVPNPTASPTDTKPPSTEKPKSISLTNIAEGVIGGFLLACVLYLIAQNLGLHLQP
jgi:hypothetical protein